MIKKRHVVASRPQRQTGGIFTGAQNIIINGGTFTSAVYDGRDRQTGFDILQEHVATSAFHNSAQLPDSQRCHERTRTAVLEEIFAWIVGHLACDALIAWLSGAAGAGKSAICQSVAEMCIANGIPVASFFFVRADHTRNTVEPLVATLAYQLIQLLPRTKTSILQAVEANPLIFKQALDTQFKVLIARPLRELQISGLDSRLLIIIDGVDECSGDENQMNLIRTIARSLRTEHLPLIVLFSSRHDNQMKMVFNALEIKSILFRLVLDDRYFPDNDIRLFLNDKFREIKEIHPMNNLLGDDWPTSKVSEEIVVKSSGQFIYASVVIKFVSFPRSNPATQLDIVRGLRPSGKSSPFAQLDVLYRHIFAHIQDLHITLLILAYVALTMKTHIGTVAGFLKLTENDVHAALVDVASVVACEERHITFLHACIPDFILDPVRSREYYIGTACARLAILWFEYAASARFTGQQDISIISFLDHADVSPELRARILAFRPSKYIILVKHPSYYNRYLTAVQKLDFADGGGVYRQQLRAFTRFINEEIPEELEILDQEHDISESLLEIKCEDAKALQVASVRKEGSVKLGKLKAWVTG